MAKTRGGDLRLRDWFARRSFDGSTYTIDSLRGLDRPSVSLVLPARAVEATIGDVLDGIEPVRAAGLVDEVVVMAAGDDGTAEKARARGATVLERDLLMADFGPSLGKGDALWRGLAATSGEIVLFIDTDTRNFHAGFVTGLLGPLLHDPSLQLVKGTFGRPLLLGEARLEGEGGRVTELVARPLINLHFPELVGFVQPLAGELAARRMLLESLPFPVGYGVEIGLLIDALEEVGLDALGQVDLGRREDRSKSLGELGPMAHAVLVTVARRARIATPREPERFGLAGPNGIEFIEIETIERPRLSSLSEGRAGSLR